MKKSRHKRTKLKLCHLYEISRIGKCMETERRLEVTGAAWRGHGKLLLNGSKVSACG